MKKLMTVLASAATALCAVATEPDFTETYTDFEGLTAGQAFDSNNGMDSHWVGASDAELFISNHTDTISVSRPNYDGRSDANANYLAIENSVTRGLNTTEGGEFAGVAIPDDGIYLDTLVKFTAADEVFGEDALASGDKIAIEYVAQGDDVDNPITNFVIRAGKTVEGSLVSANYLAAVPENFDVNAWHRLTVRVIDNVGNGQVGQVGFVIYLDGDVNKLLAYDTNVDAGFGELNPTAQKFYNENLHALYPSAVENTVPGYDKIASATFSGTGCIDDVVFTTTTPNFIQQGEAVSVPFVADAGVTAITVSVAGVTDPISVVNGSATLPAQTTAFTVNVTVDTANGYTLGGISYNGAPVVNGEVTGYTGGDITITTIRNNFNLFDENGDPIQGTFQTLTEAFAAEGVAMIKLAYDYDALAFEGDDFDGYDIDGEIVLDLNGNDLDGGDDSAGVSLFRVADTLTIKDSVGGGSITYDTQYGYAIVKNDGSDVFIGAATGDAGATFNGKLFEDGYEGAIIKGNIDNANNADEGVFLWVKFIDSDSDYELVGDYWVVEPQGVIGTYTVTVTPAANATYAAAYKVGGETITPANDVLTVTVGQTIVITATPATNYEYAETPTGWTAGQDGEITIEVSAAGMVAIPAPSEKTLGTYTVTVTPDQNATYAAAYKVGGETITPENDVLMVTVGQTIVITATPAANYEYAETPTGWTAGQDGEITIEVSEAAEIAIPAPTAKQQSEYPSYIDENVAYKSAYDTWKTNNNVAAGDNKYEAAFLLNIAPGAEDQTLEPASITIADGKVVITANKNLGTVNGKVYVKTATTLAGLKTAEWVAATLDDDKAINVTPGSTDEAGFYQIKVDF